MKFSDKTEISPYLYTPTLPPTLQHNRLSVVWLRINHRKKLFSRNEGLLLVCVLGGNRITEMLLAIATDGIVGCVLMGEEKLCLVSSSCCKAQYFVRKRCFKHLKIFKFFSKSLTAVVSSKYAV